ncbi:MAG: hypothetical protein C4532_13520 [Candidatus Abyssobacteria bacterium SURF_17]|jgi:hypothetical protein|uniref:Uncharacterized protein n=1 Tax=Candidatus Abyssobacteria bacterium SURF_17 TaxID=2093361 RepID=A0A419EUU8_9BACT|nr:MAG: hypothetical protein C4532_13520 [Candidatus Abyssubacteria bacterium SURF_17]
MEVEMRPTIAELIAGITRTLNTTALPIVLNSGDTEAFLELMITARLLAFVESRWDKEYERLIRENTAMEGLLKEAADALQQINYPDGVNLVGNIEEYHFDIQAIPSISELHEHNVERKKKLQRFILIHTSLKERQTPELCAVRAKIRDFLKDLNNRDLEAAQLILAG